MVLFTCTDPVATAYRIQLRKSGGRRTKAFGKLYNLQFMKHWSSLVVELTDKEKDR